MRADRTDPELMAAVARGDLNALGVLFERHHALVHSLCYRMTGSSSVADDLAQESFLRVLRYSVGFEARAAFTTWLYRLVRNVCVDHLDAESRSLARATRMASEQEHLRESAIVEASETDPRLETLAKALYALPAERREVLVLSRYMGLSYAEIAEVCDTTVGAIKVRAHRAMRELRSRFEELEQAL
jgi:RNA polymerase sigma-70 factor (ECF subfamily)